MVQASTIIIAAFAIAPVLAAPAPFAPKVHQGTIAVEARDISPEIEGLEIDARDPWSLRKTFRKAKRIAEHVAPHVAKFAPLILRDESGSLVELDLRELDFNTLVERDLDVELDARDPFFNFRKAWRKIRRVAKHVGGIALKVAPLLVRDEQGALVDVEMRDLFDAELDAREPGPEIDFGKLHRAGRTAVNTAKLFIRDDDGNVYYVREVEPSAESELEAREPKLRIGRILRKAKGFGKQVLGKATQAQRLGQQALGTVDRAQKLGKQAVGTVNQAHSLGKQALGTAKRLSSLFGLRELDVLEELESRGFFDVDELEELAARREALEERSLDELD